MSINTINQSGCVHQLELSISAGLKPSRPLQQVPRRAPLSSSLKQGLGYESVQHTAIGSCSLRKLCLNGNKVFQRQLYLMLL